MASIRLNGPSRIPGIPAGSRPRGGRTADEAGGGLSHNAPKPRDREPGGGPPTHGSTPTSAPSRLPSRIPHTNLTVRRNASTTSAIIIGATSNASTTSPSITTLSPPSQRSMAAPQLPTPRRTVLSPPKTTSGIPRSGMSAPARQSPVDSRSIAVKPLRNTLRRKQTSIARESTKEIIKESPRDILRIPPAKESKRIATGSPLDQQSDSGYVLLSDQSASPAEIRVAEVETTSQPISIYPDMPVYPELDRYRNVQPTLLPEPMGLPLLTTHDLPPPTPGWYSASRSDLSSTSSPSTRFSESPGFFSRETTPTSTASLSPCVVAPLRIPPAKTRSGSPTRSRPPVTWRRNGSVSRLPDDFVGAHEPQGLPSVRESITSSSSGSTIRAVNDTPSPPRQRKQPPTPIEPPPRKSSYKSDTESSKASKVVLIKAKESPKDAKKPAPVRVQSPGKPLGSSTMSSRLRSPSTPTVITTPPTAPALLSSPARPSREGTTALRSQGLPLPVVHSNLTINTERRGSEPTIGNAVLRSATTVSLPDTCQQATRPSPETPKAENKLTKPEPAKRHMRTPSPNTNTLQSRFPFFRRKMSTTEDKAAPTKLVRKGPAAGTGHEGYGRFGNHRRSSAGSMAGLKPIQTPISSSESLASNLTTDPFLLERMNPVIIAGGEVKENRNISFDLGRSESSPNVPAMAMTPDLSMDRNTPWPTAMPAESPETNDDSRRPSDASEMDTLEMKPQGMARRSLQRLRQSIGPVIPKSARNSISGSATSLDSSPIPDTPEPRPSIGDRSITAPTIVVPKKLSKQLPKSPPPPTPTPQLQRKWNFFSWGTNKQKEEKQSRSRSGSHSASPSVSSVQSKPVAYYDDVDPLDTRERASIDKKRVSIDKKRASIDKKRSSMDKKRNSSEQSRSQTSIETPAIPPEWTLGPTTPEPSDVPFIFEQQPLPPRPENVPFIFEQPLPPPPPAAVTTNKVMLRSGKPSRLAQVGRIPKVIQNLPVPPSPTKSIPQHLPVPPSPTKIFSRPFNRLSLQPVVTDGNSLPVDPEFVAKGPSPTTPHPSTPECNDFYADARLRSHQAYPSADTNISADIRRAIDMFSFSPLRHDSVATSCTTSTSFSSVDDEEARPVTTTIPPTDAFAEDDIWHEYDDLIDDAAMERFARVNSSVMWLQAHQRSAQQLQGMRRLLDEALHEEERATCSSVYSDDMPERLMAAFGGEHSQTSRLAPQSEAFSFKPEPLSGPVSGTMAENTPGHGHSMSVDSGRDKIMKRGSGNSYLTQLSARSSRSSDDESPLGQVNLRVGSMSVSKWLTFGHVLFSPVRHSLTGEERVPGRALNRHSVLVIDGLDNDDWAYYAAETYPAATFFNLSPRAPLPQNRRNSTSMPLRPQNHHQIQYASHLHRFPFASESFRSVVYRFPAAAPESHYRNVVAEARRVLQPGGYMELAILDADLHNMGGRGRRAVRKIKELLHAKTPMSNLTPAADFLVRQLGAQGFVDIKTCRVGIPVASPIPHRTNGKKEVRTVADLMADEGEAADASITRMVARVGRWWYHRCYEVPVGIEMEAGMWGDKGLREECVEMGTRLKLTVCYARVPEGHARVASV